MLFTILILSLVHQIGMSMEYNMPNYMHLPIVDMLALPQHEWVYISHLNLLFYRFKKWFTDLYLALSLDLKNQKTHNKNIFNQALKNITYTLQYLVVCILEWSLSIMSMLELMRICRVKPFFYNFFKKHNIEILVFIFRPDPYKVLSKYKEDLKNDLINANKSIYFILMKYFIILFIDYLYIDLCIDPAKNGLFESLNQLENVIREMNKESKLPQLAILQNFLIQFRDLAKALYKFIYEIESNFKSLIAMVMRFS